MHTVSCYSEKENLVRQVQGQAGLCPSRDFLLFAPTPSGRRQKYFVVAEPQQQDFGVASKGQAGIAAFVTLSSHACHKADLGQGWLSQCSHALLRREWGA